MKSTKDLEIQHNCSECSLSTSEFFCDLPEDERQKFESLKITHTYSKGANLFVEGQPSNGIYMLCQGKIKLSTCSQDGKIIILRVAEAGEVLGLSATVSDSAYETTAEVVEASQINFVRKNDFMDFLKENPSACLSAVKQLSQIYHAAHVQICSLGLANSVSDKLARLLLSWCESETGKREIRLKVSYTHEEIAEMIGTSRETVSRILKDFKTRNLISVKGSELTVIDRRELEMIVGSKHRVVSAL